MPSIPIAIARRRAALARRGLLFGSVLAFAATIGLARSNHPATAHAAAAAPATSSTQTSSSTDSLGQPQISSAPSSQTPNVSTGAS